MPEYRAAGHRGAILGAYPWQGLRVGLNALRTRFWGLFGHLGFLALNRAIFGVIFDPFSCRRRRGFFNPFQWAFGLVRVAGFRNPTTPPPA